MPALFYDGDETGEYLKGKSQEIIAKLLEKV